MQGMLDETDPLRSRCSFVADVKTTAEKMALGHLTRMHFILMTGRIQLEFEGGQPAERAPKV